MTDAREPAFIEPLPPWPLGLAVRWRRKDAISFLAAARQFVQDSGFNAYAKTNGRAKEQQAL